MAAGMIRNVLLKANPIPLLQEFSIVAAKRRRARTQDLSAGGKKTSCSHRARRVRGLVVVDATVRD
jgi:hypothetical protein